MQISTEMQAKLNEQIKVEFDAAHTYLAMSVALGDMGLKALDGLFIKQAAEERDHALKIVKYLGRVGGRARLAGVDEPKAEYASVEAVVQAALDSEQNVTQCIDGLMDQAEQENDHATQSFLQWFVDEQVEEVESMRELLELIQMAGPNQTLLVEHIVAQRGE